MTGLAEGLPALGAALMMAASPVTGPCEGRMVQLCTGSGEVRHMLIWDEEAPSREPAANKACHACTPEQRRRTGKGNNKI